MTSHPEHDLLSAYADGELDAAERRVVDAHLGTCADARELLGAIRAGLSDLASLDEPAMDPQVSFAIRAALARERKLSSKSRRFAWVAGAAAAAMVGILTFSLAGDGGTAGREQSGAAADAALAPEVLADANYDEKTVGGVLSSYVADAYGVTLASGEARSKNDTGGGGAPAPMQAYSADQDPTMFRDCIRAVERESDSVRLVRSFSATYKGEPVYILLFEVPAKDPERVEMWVTAKETCQVRYFTQHDIAR